MRTKQPRYLYAYNKSELSDVSVTVVIDKKRVDAFDENGNRLIRKQVRRTFGWKVQITRDDKVFSQMFSHSKYKSKNDTKKAAQAYLNDILAQYPFPKTAVENLKPLLFRKRWIDKKTKKIYDYMVLEWRVRSKEGRNKVKNKLFMIKNGKVNPAIKTAKTFLTDNHVELKLNKRCEMKERKLSYTEGLN